MTVDTTPAAADNAGYPPRSQAYYGMAAMMLVTMFSILDRYIPAILVQPIRAELGVTDTGISFIQGWAFSLFYCLAGLPMGRLVDRSRRNRIIAAGAVVWSVATIACGFSQGYWQLLVARMGVGIGEACLAPAAYSLIADYFQPNVRGRAISIYYLSLTVGASVSFLIGGLVLRLTTGMDGLTLPVVGTLAPWRLVFITVGVPGIPLALLMLSVREPQRQHGVRAAGLDGDPAFSRFLSLNRGPLSLIYLAYGAMTFATLCALPWAPTLYLRRFGMPTSTSGVYIGIATLVGGVAGVLLSGALSDRWRFARWGGRFRVPALAIACNLPVTLSYPVMPTAWSSITLLGLATAISAFGTSSAAATIQAVVPNTMRGQAMALFQIIALLAGALAPTAVALTTDYVFRSDASLPASLQLAPGILLVIALIAAAFGLRAYDRLRASAG